MVEEEEGKKGKSGEGGGTKEKAEEGRRKGGRRVLSVSSFCLEVEEEGRRGRGEGRRVIG